MISAMSAAYSELDKMSRNMINGALAAFLVTILGLGGLVYHDTNRGLTLSEQLHASVKVELEMGHGSGVLIAPDLILTNSHVTIGERDVTLRFYDGETVTGSPLWNSEVNLPGLDLSLVKLDEPVEGIRPARIRCDTLAVGRTIRTIGNPLSLTWTATEGTVASLHSVEFGSPAQDGNYFFMDVGVLPGNSGGAVFGPNGHIVGLTQGAILDGGWGGSISGLGIAVSGKAICDAIPSLPRG